MAIADLSLDDGEKSMMDFYVASTNAQSNVVMVAKNNQVGKSSKTRTMGICAEVPPIAMDKSNFVLDRDLHYRNFARPYSDALAYFASYEKRQISNWEGNAGPFDTFTAKIIQLPKHGTLVETKWDKDKPFFNPSVFAYTPSIGFEGDDTAIIETTVNGWKLKQRYYFKVTTTESTLEKQCDGKGPQWKISQSDADPSTQDPATWLRSAQLSALLASASQSLTDFTDLPGTAVGQTVGEGAAASITLDTNAAGHGWYVDPTPLDNTDDYLPTSNPNIWQAKAGSDAAGKMDMLSVLLHEYGHALGLEHSAQLGDFMNTSLQTGQRRLPSSEELALMGQLVAQIKASQGAAADAAPSTPTSPQDPSG